MTDSQFQRYESEVLREVRAPGPDAVRHTVFRRQRARTLLLGVVAAAAVATAVGQYATGPAVNSTALEGPSGYAASGSASGSGSASASGSKPAGPPFAVVDGVDLHVIAASTVTFKPTKGTYHGTITIEAYNSGRRPYELTMVYLGLPAGVTVDFAAAASPGFGPCMGADTSDESVGCTGQQVIPAAGGHIQYVVPLNVAIAGQTTAMTMDQPFTFRLAARNNEQGSYPDVSPQDNKVWVTVVLAADGG